MEPAHIGREAGAETREPGPLEFDGTLGAAGGRVAPGPRYTARLPERLSAVGDRQVQAEAPDLDAAMEFGSALVRNLGQVLLGSHGVLTAAAVAALSAGHLLIEDVPGVGKTVLARALALSLGSELSRVQGHADLLPSDVTGVSVYLPDSRGWEFRPGPLFSHFVLVDELNRTPPRTQSALLEAMEEGQVTVDGESWPLPRPHMVIATQNPLSQRGTYPLVESQLDRFAVATTVGYPDAVNESQLVLHHGGKFALEELRPVGTTEQWSEAQRATVSVPVAPPVAQYAVELCRATRVASGVLLGASPRSAILLVRSAQAYALLSGRDFVAPGDVKAVAGACLAHRLVMSDGEGSVGGTRVITQVLETTPSPRP
jgi:MoxR-like ATPase